MDRFVDERDFKLLDRDRYTFFVLRRILGGQCKLVLSDHEKIIICLSSEPFPVWIWTPDDASDKDMAAAYDAIVQIITKITFSFNITTIINSIRI